MKNNNLKYLSYAQGQIAAQQAQQMQQQQQQQQVPPPRPTQQQPPCGAATFKVGLGW